MNWSYFQIRPIWTWAKVNKNFKYNIIIGWFPLVLIFKGFQISIEPIVKNLNGV
jgi:hypothetical protein